MKKVLFLLVSLVAVFSTMTTLTSCGDEDLGLLMIVESGVGLWESKVSPETKADAMESKKKIDARLEKIFGKTYNVKGENGVIPEIEAFRPHSDLIKNDPEIRKEFEHLATLKTQDDEQAVSYVVIHFMADNDDKLEVAYTIYPIPYTDETLYEIHKGERVY